MNSIKAGATKAAVLFSMLSAGLAVGYSQCAEAATRTASFTYTDYYYRHVPCSNGKLCDDVDVLDHVDVKCDVSVEDVWHPRPSEGAHLIHNSAKVSCKATYPAGSSITVSNYGATTGSIWREGERRYYPGDSHHTVMYVTTGGGAGGGYADYGLSSQNPGLCWSMKRSFQARWNLNFDVYSSVSKQRKFVRNFSMVSDWLNVSNSILSWYYPWC